MTTRYTYTRHAAAHTVTSAGLNYVIVPDQVAENQRAWDESGKSFPATWARSGRKVRAVLRGDEYGLYTTGTGDMVVAII